MNNPYQFNSTNPIMGYAVPQQLATNSFPNAQLGVQPPHMEIAKVAGMESVYAYPMGPNASTILMDMNKPLIYVVVTDASSYKTVTPFSISKYEETSEVDSRFDAINKRLNDIEERMKNNAAGQSNYKSSWPKPANTESGTNSSGSANR